MKKLIVLVAGLTLALHLSGCSLFKSSDENAASDESVASDSNSEENTELDGDNKDTASNDSMLDDQLPEEALGEKTASTDLSSPPPDEPMAPATDVAASESTPPPAETASVDTGTTTNPADVSASPTEPIGDVTAMSSPSESAPVAPEAISEKPKASLKKVESMPMTREGILLNAVYIARPKDNFKKISKMIYGSNDKASELKKANPGVSPKVGDKIYYNSPVRPTDDTKIVTYYEDNGMLPEVYVAKEGDDIKKVSKQLLGYDNAWKETWALNTVESKGKMPAGTELRYWKVAPVAAVAAAADVAMNTPPPAEMPPPPAQEMSPPPPAQEMSPPPPPAQVDAAPPPPVAQDLPPPPPPEVEQAAPPPTADLPPPPPPPVAKNTPHVEADQPMGLDNDMIMSLAGAGILAVLAAGVIIARKRRAQKEMAAAFNDTQVGT